MTVPDRPSVLSLVVLPATILPVVGVTLSSAPVTATVAVGATVSTLIARVPALLILPAASVAVALSVSLPWPMAVMSAAVRL